jgi:hypothetical protein
VKNRTNLRKQLALLLVLAPAIAGCSGASDMFQSDMLSKDAEWFKRPGRLFIQNVSIDAPPLTPDKPVTAEDLVSAEGACPGMQPSASPADANASTNGPAGAPPTGATGTVALGHTECDVVRGIGAPDNVNISNQRGDRVAVVTWSRGPRAGIYTFTAGRLASIEGVPTPPEAPKAAKSKKTAKKKQQSTG